jgi:hypothetical protein
MSSSPPNSSPVREATKGALDWTEEKLKAVVQRFRDRKIAFIKDIETINLAKEQRTTPEWKLFIENVKDGTLRILFQMGLTLRKLENLGQSIHPLRDKIFKKYGIEGLHVAVVVQNEIFAKYVGNILVRAPTSERLKSEIENLFKNIENTVVFVQALDDIKKKSDVIVSKINAHSPNTFIISSATSAMEKCKQITENVMQRVSDYTHELYKSDIKRIYFLNRKEGTDF